MKLSTMIRILAILLVGTAILMTACTKQYTLSTSVTPVGSGTVSPESGAYDEGTELTLAASPSPGYIFDRWNGDAIGSSSPLTLVMDSEKNIRAYFKPEYALSTTVAPAGGGTVSPESGLYGAGTELTLKATAAPGYRFDYWSGDATGDSNPLTLVMDREKSVTAHFKAQYALSIAVAPAGGGTVSPDNGMYML